MSTKYSPCCLASTCNSGGMRKSRFQIVLGQGVSGVCRVSSSIIFGRFFVLACGFTVSGVRLTRWPPPFVTTAAPGTAPALLFLVFFSFGRLSGGFTGFAVGFSKRIVMPFGFFGSSRESGLSRTISIFDACRSYFGAGKGTGLRLGSIFGAFGATALEEVDPLVAAGEEMPKGWAK